MRESSRRAWLPLFLLVLLLLLLVFGEAGFLSPLEGVFHYVLDPIQRFFAGATGGIGDLFGTVRDVRALRAEAEELRGRVDALTAENIQLREVQAEVETLRAQLNFVEEFPISAYIGADVVERDACLKYPCGEVIGAEPNPYLYYVTINVGAQHGVEVGDPVVSNGPRLVGRVAEVFPRTSRVRLILDRESAVAAILQDSRVTGLIIGQPDGTLRMEYIPLEEQIQVGEIALTSGLGGVFPKSLVIGQVAEIEKKDYALSQAAIIRPALDFSRLELLLVITEFEPVPLDNSTQP